MLPYILDVVSYIEAVMLSVQYCNDIRIGCEVLYSAYDVTQKLGVMSLKSGCDTSGDVVNYSTCDLRITVGVISSIEWM